MCHLSSIIFGSYHDLFICYHKVVNLACFVDGEVTKINHIKEIEEMESFVFLEIYPGYEVGSIVKRTKDIRTDCGWIHLIHEDEKKLNEDCKRIRTLMRTMFTVQ